MANLENKLTWQNFGFEVRYHVHDREYGIRDRHAHDGFYELVVVRSGSATHVHDGVKSHIESGDVYLIPPGEPHYYANARQLGIYNVLFTGDFFAGLLAEFPGAPDIEAYLGLSGGALPEGHRADVRRFDPELFFRITALLDEIVEEETQELSGARLMILSNALKILTLICRHARRSAERNIGSAGYRIASLVKTLEADFAGEWSLRRMAEHTGFSVACFRRQFRRIIGEPPVAWLLSLRLEKAAMMLQTGDGSIAETAEACGFPDSNYFTRMFHRRFGATPRAYRLGLRRRTGGGMEPDGSTHLQRHS